MEVEKHKEAIVQLQNAQLMSACPQPSTIEAPTLKNLPFGRQRLESNAANNYTYSLCESIDYQTESLLPSRQQE